LTFFIMATRRSRRKFRLVQYGTKSNKDKLIIEPVAPGGLESKERIGNA
jgi:hypothetical protein